MTNRLKKFLAALLIICALAAAGGLPDRPASNWVTGNDTNQCDEDCPNVGGLPGWVN